MTSARKKKRQITDTEKPSVSHSAGSEPKTSAVSLGFFEKHELKWILAITVVCFLVFANTLGGEFVYDDARQILRNPLIQDNSLFWKALTSDVWAFKGDGTIAASNYWRPTFTLWHIINFRLFGANPFGWHLLNIALHAGVCVMAFALLRKWGFSALIACAIALIFAAHPVHVESVAWISGSPDLLFSLALLGSIWFVVKARESAEAGLLSGNFLLAFLLYALALGAKEIGILCIPIYYLIFSDKKDTDGAAKPNLIPVIVFAGIAVVYFLARFSVLGAVSRPPEDAVSITTALLSFPKMFTFYLQQIFFPIKVAANYPLQPVHQISLTNFIIPAFISLAALAALYFLAKKARKGWLAASLFLLPLIPAINATAFIPDQIVHDRYLYLPLLGVLMLTLPLLTKFIPERDILIAGCVIAALLCAQTIPYNRAWAKELDLWTWTAQVDNSAFTLNQYGTFLNIAGRNDEAIGAFTRSLETRPMQRAYLGRGRAHLGKKQYAEAEKDLLAILAMPMEKQEAYALYQTYEALAICYSEQKRPDEALAQLQEARKQLPIYGASLTAKMAVVLYQKGDKESTLRELESVKAQARKELLPESKQVFLLLGMLYGELGRKDEARSALQEYIAATQSINDAITLRERQRAANLLKSL
jgi:tetratricopeptide (TPR) repeat protein